MTSLAAQRQEDAAERNEDELVEARAKQKQELLVSLRQVLKEVRDFTDTLRKAATEVLNGAETVGDKFQDMKTALGGAGTDEVLGGAEDLRAKLASNAFASYVKIVKALIQTERKSAGVKEVQDMVEAWQPQDLSSDTPDAEAALTEKFQQSAQEPTEEEVRAHKLIKEDWRGKLGNPYNEDYDDEDVMIEGGAGGIEIPSKCPITMLPMTDPLRSTKCGHIVSKEGVNQLFRKSKDINCPMPGCRQKLSKSNFQVDEKIERQLERERMRRKREQELSQISNDIEDDLE